MADPHPARPGERPEREDKRSLFQKLVEFIRPGPDSTDELIGTLAEAEDNEVIDAESRVMLEGVLRMADMTAGDGVAFQQVVEQAGQGGELAADAGPGEAALFETAALLEIFGHPVL